MKKCLFSLLAMLVPLLPMTAQAGGYVGVDYVLGSIEPEFSNSDADVQALEFKIGTYFNSARILGGEFRLALGTGDDEVSGVDIEIDRYYGVFVRAQLPDGPVRPYGILGLSRVETTESPGGGENYHDISVGIGADMQVANNLFVSLELMQLVDSSEGEITNLGIGLGGRF